MAIQLKNAGTFNSVNGLWKSVLFFSLVLVIVFLGLYNQPLFFDKPRSDHTSASKKLHSTQSTFDVGNGYERPLVVYAYAESANARQNFNFFLKRGLHAGADFIFIFNGETNASDLVPTHLENVKVVKRDNTCYDMGAFGEVLAKDGLWERYKRFITLNASVRGPFLPIWSDECWTDAFLNKVTDKVKVSRLVSLARGDESTRLPVLKHKQLVGLTYQCNPNPHVQSMLLATDQTGMRILLDPELAYSVPLDTKPWGGPELPVGYSICYAGYAEAVSENDLPPAYGGRPIKHFPLHELCVKEPTNASASCGTQDTDILASIKVHAEIGMARLIRSQGYDVDVMLTSVHAATPDNYCDKKESQIDTLSNGGYFGSNVHPYELIFAKANRGIDEGLLSHLTEWHYAMNETSWDSCGRYGSR